MPGAHAGGFRGGPARGARPASPTHQPPPGVDPETEAALCLASPLYLITNYGVIDNKTDADEASDGTKMPFRPWPAQIPVLSALWTCVNVIVLKARQLGISWLVCAYVWWVCVAKPSRTVFLFSENQKKANELIRRIKMLQERLPAWLAPHLPGFSRKPNVRDLAWTNGSTVQSMPATPTSGAGYTADLIVLDEAARMKWGAALYADAKPTVDAGGQLIVVSTAYGFGNFFHSLWTKSVAGANSFRALFLPWWARPGRDHAWYADKVRNSEDPATIPQDYPANPVEAFRSTGRLRFPAEHVARQAARVREPLPPESWPRTLLARRPWPGLVPGSLPAFWELPGLSVYEGPEENVAYVVAADVAEGKDPDGTADSDFCAAVVLRRDTRACVATLHGRWEPDRYAEYLMVLSEPYNRAPVVVERNNHGHVVLATFRKFHFPHERVATGHDGWPGWLTNQVTKAEGVNGLAAALRDGTMAVRSAAALNEFHVYAVKKDGSTGAPAGHHDDYVSAWVCGLSWLARQVALPADEGPALGGASPRIPGFDLRY